MQIDAGGLHSVVGDVSTLNSALESLSYSEPNARQIQDAMACFPLPLTLEEAVNTSVCGQLPSHATIATSAGIWNLHSGSDTIKDCLVGTSYPFVKNIQDPNLFMDGIPISGAAPLHTLYVARYGTFEDQEKLTNLDSSEYPLDSPYRTVPDHLPVEGSSFETTKCCYDGSLNTSTKFDVSKFVSPELFGKLVERNGSENSAPDRWILSENTVGMDCSSPVACHNGLSLSLSTYQPCRTPVREHCSELPTITSYCSYSKHIRSEQMSCSSSKQSLNFKSYKPLQLSLLSESKFSHAMQEILAEMACYLLSYSSTCIDNGINTSFSSHGPSRQGFSTSDGIDDGCRFIFQNELTLERSDDAKKKRLLDLLQVVDDQYNQCLDEVHTVISAFHAVIQLDPNLHARFALPTIASMYKNLRERISCHILEIGASCIDASGTQEEKSFETTLIQKQWALQQLRKRDPQLWRPQRGLPERSVSVLRAWMFQNFLHPYPKDAEKHLLALKSGLTRSQVSNWFINARVRLWKPMIEEMYAEMSRSKARRIDEESNGIHKNHVLYKDRDLP